MKSRMVLFTACLLVASHALAQTPPPAPRAPKAPPAPAAPPAAPAPPAAAPPPPPVPPAPRGQPINIRVELTITETGAGIASVKKNVVAVVGDGFSGYVREQGMVAASGGANFPPFERNVPLNLDAFPVILQNGKIRLTCTIQYLSGPPPSALAPGESREPARSRTDIKQNLVLNLDSGKSLVVSDATDPITDRRVTVEVMATILK